MPNDDYIKRSDALFELHSYVSGNDPTLIIAYRVDLCEIIEKIPTADVEPVIHCRDCKYRNQRIPVHNAVCTKCYEMDCMQGYGFCSMGERMEEDDA